MGASTEPSIAYRKALASDARAIQELVNSLAEDGQLLKRSLSDIYENLRDFTVATHEGRVVACAALHVCWEDVAEIRSLAVERAYQDHGIGSELVRLCVEEARALGVATVFTLTYIPAFFERLGFVETDKADLPHKIWKDCLNCVKFPSCDETALTLRLDGV